MEITKFLEIFSFFYLFSTKVFCSSCAVGFNLVVEVIYKSINFLKKFLTQLPQRMIPQQYTKKLKHLVSREKSFKSSKSLHHQYLLFFSDAPLLIFYLLQQKIVVCF